MNFKAKLSNTAIIVTLLFYGIIMYVAYRTSLAVPPFSMAERLLTIGLVMLGIFLIFFRTKGYKVEQESILLEKPGYTKKIAMEEIGSISLVRYKALGITFRLFGSGGVWGFYGIFYSTRFKKLRFDATSLSGDLVLIVLNNGKKYILSPERPAEFLQTVCRIRHMDPQGNLII